MALFPKTPGVYVQEISTLPPSVVAVPTAIPVFIGHTQKGTKATVMSPVRIESLLDYEQIFGGPFLEKYTASVSNTTVSVAATASFSSYNLYRNLQMFYNNGGGTCYIISVGNYTDTITAAQLTAGITKAEEADEITLMVVPEAPALTVGDFLIVNNAMLTHCNKMKDRFAIIDVLNTSTIATDATNFRDTEVGIDNLKFGAAYYPPIKTSYPRPYSAIYTAVNDTRTVPVWTDTLLGGPYNNLFSVLNGKAAWSRVDISSIAATDTLVINGITLTAGVDFTVTNALQSLQDAINTHPVLSTAVVAIAAGQATDRLAILARNGATATTSFTITSSTIVLDPVASPAAGTPNVIDTELYNSFVTLLEANKLVVHPSSTMAGIYSRVDNERGVWKAPANVGINNMDSFMVTISDQDQAGLNVDATAGKSINALRTFIGRGPIVWGARTLDGNSNEWRYVNVRRLFIMAEESCKKASEFVVFEPNDKNTWNRVKGTISNFLTNLWKDGALTGDKPEQAFFVKVGLNETMTAQDILEGKLIVQIGMAAVRPAEFIVLQFMHKLQEA